MKKILLFTSAVLFLSSASNSILAQHYTPADSAFVKSRNYTDIYKLPKYIDGKMFVKLKLQYLIDISFNKETGFANPIAAKEFDAIAKAYKLLSIKKTFTHIKNISLNSIFTFEYDKSIIPENLIADLKKSIFVEYAEQMPAYYSFYIPDDYSPATQWYLSKINAQGAWDITHGSNTVRIAIVDDAVSMTHSDLVNKVWINPGEVPGDSIDNDGDGYIDDVRGFDVSDNDTNANPPITASPTNFTHGTHVAGIAAAETDNANGMASMGFDCMYIPVKCKPDSAFGPLLPDAYLGLEYAIAINADVINMSWGGFVYSATYELLCTTAHSNGIILVAAAGNTGTQIDLYPASYDGVISVGSTNPNDMVSMFSTYGSKVDVMAPGVGIFSTLAGGPSNYGLLSGTSMSAPIVSGICALMKANNPSLTNDEIEACLESGCNNINWENQNKIGLIGAGRVNALGAVTCVEAPPGPIIGNCPGGIFVCTGNSYQFNASSMGLPATSWEWHFPGGTPSTSTLPNPVITYNYAGVYDVILIGCNMYGCDTLVMTNYVLVGNPNAAMTALYTGTVCKGSAAYLNVSFFGEPPFSFAYTNGLTIDTITNITNYNYSILVYPNNPTTYQLIWMHDNFCFGNVAGTIFLNPVDCGDCSNTDFEFGNFSTWVGYLGHCIGDTSFMTGLVSYRQQIINTPAIDPTSLGSINEISPDGGNFSVRLGNWFVGGEAEKLRKTFLVTSNNANFTYQYAVFLQDPPGHAPNDKPKFEVKIMDEHDSLIPGPCGHYQVTAGLATQGWQQNGITRFKDWTTVAVDLTPYIGHSITVEFKTEDCRLLGHYGYAYIDATCGPQAIHIDGFCDGATQIQLSAPAGYISYHWFPYGDTTQTITINAPVAGDTVTVTMTNAMGCTSSITHVFQSMPAPVPKIACIDTNICRQDTVTLTATGAASGTNYSWTSIPLGFTSNDSAIVVMPQFTTTYFLTEVNANGCPSDSTAHFTVMVDTTLYFQLGPNIVFCKGDTVTIAVAHDSSLTYSWTSYPPGFISDTNVIRVLPAYPTYYILTINNGTCNFRDSIRVSMFNYLSDGPVAQVPFCSGDTVLTLSAPADYHNFFWIPNGDSTQSIIINNPVNYTMYSVAMISSIGCLDTARFMLEPIPDPTADAGPDTSVCLGFVVPLYASGAITPDGTYTWTSIPSGYIANTATIYVSPTVDTYYIVEVTNGPDCDAPPAFDTVLVKVIPSPVFDLGPDITICYGDSVIITKSFSDGFDFWTSDPPGFISNDSTVVLKPTVHTIYYLTINTATCTYSDYFAIDVVHGNMLPDTLKKNYCNGDTITTISAPSGYLSYYWVQTGETSQSITITNPIPGGLFTVLGVNTTNGCKDTMLISLNKLQAIRLYVTASDSNLCKGEYVQLSANTIDNAGYSWTSIPAGFTSADQNIDVMPDSTIIYVCQADSNGCKAKDSVFIKVNIVPYFHFGNDTTLCFGEKLLLDPKVNAEVYGWNNGYTDSTLIADTSGLYSLTVSNSECIVKDSIRITILPEDLPFNIPNVFTPNNDGHNDFFEIRLLNTETFSMEIYDRWGKLMFRTEDPNKYWDGKNNGNNVSEGVYYYVATYKSTCNNKLMKKQGTVSLYR